MKFKESKSIYLQIADRICDEILQGQYTEEERILSVREYAATVEVNANTVVRTYDYLQGQEIIYNKRGIGYFVSLLSQIFLIHFFYLLHGNIQCLHLSEKLRQVFMKECIFP